MAIIRAPDAEFERLVVPYSASGAPEFSPVKEPMAIFVVGL